MSLQLLQPHQMNQWVAPHLAQQQLAYYYHCDQQQVQTQKAIQHWSNISPRESESEGESDGSSCHSSVSNPSPRSIESGIFDLSLADDISFEQPLSPTFSERSDRKTPTCLGILDEMDELDLSEPELPKVNIPAKTMAFVQQSNMGNGLSLSAPPTPRTPRDISACHKWVAAASAHVTPVTSGHTTPNGGLISPTEYVPVSNAGVFPTSHLDQQTQHRVRSSTMENEISSRRQRQRSRHSMRQYQHQQHYPQANVDYHADNSQGQMSYHHQQQMQYQQYLQQQQYIAQQQAALDYAAYQQQGYGYPQQSYAYSNHMNAAHPQMYNCM